MNAQPIRRAAVLVLLTLGFATAWSLFLAAGRPRDGNLPRDEGRHQLSGPFAHENLTVFLVHGQDRFQGKNYLTLPEAIEQKKFIIHETQNVNELRMENLSPGEEVLILSGDILKGGQQDRIAQFDMLVPPNSGKVPLPAFCVEHTAPRWMARLEGANKTFAGSPGQAGSNTLRLAARLNTNQGEVWNAVAAGQIQLSTNAGVSVKSMESDSSLALSLDAKPVREATEKYITRLSAVPQDKRGVIGYVYAINGKIYGADVYGSSALFQKVWPRLLKANAAEAFAELQKGKSFAPVTQSAVRVYMAEVERGKTSTQDVGYGVRQTTCDNARNVLFESAAKKGEVLRRNIVSH
jgi:hypothetical protein